MTYWYQWMAAAGYLLVAVLGAASSGVALMERGKRDNAILIAFVVAIIWPAWVVYGLIVKVFDKERSKS